MGLGRLVTLLSLQTILLSSLACRTTVQQPSIDSTSTKPAATETYTPSPTPTRTPRPTPVYQEVQGINVPTNVYLKEGIPMMIQGEEKLINFFWYGTAGQDYSRNLELKGNVYVIGDVRPGNVTCVDSPQIYRAAGSDIHDFFSFEQQGTAGWSGINTEYENNNGVHRGEPYYDETHNVSIQLINGFFNCVGTPKKPVLFTSDAEEPSRWMGFFTVKNATISNVIFEYYRYMNTEPGGNVEISDSIFRHAGGAMIWLEGKNITLENNEFYDTTHEHIGGESFGNNNIIRYNYFDGTIANDWKGHRQSLCIGFGGFEGIPQIYGNSFNNCELLFLAEPKIPVEEFTQYLKENNELTNVYFN